MKLIRFFWFSKELLFILNKAVLCACWVSSCSDLTCFLSFFSCWRGKLMVPGTPEPGGTFGDTHTQAGWFGGRPVQTSRFSQTFFLKLLPGPAERVLAKSSADFPRVCVCAGGLRSDRTCSSAVCPVQVDMAESARAPARKVSSRTSHARTHARRAGLGAFHGLTFSALLSFSFAEPVFVTSQRNCERVRALSPLL